MGNLISQKWFGPTLVGSLVLVFLLLVIDWLDWLGNPLWVTAAATIGLVAAASATLVVVVKTADVAVSSLRDAEKTRHGQLIVDLSERWDEEGVIESLKFFGAWTNEGLIELVEVLFNQELRPPTEEELDDWYRLTLVPGLMETIGVLAAEDVITDGVIHKMWGPLIVGYWNGWKPAIEQLRRYDNEYAENSYTYFEQLAERMLRRSQEAVGAEQARVFTADAEPVRDSPADAEPEDERSELRQ